MTFPLSGDRQFYSEKHTIAAGATVKVRLQFQPDIIKFISMVTLTNRVDIKLGGMKGTGVIPLFGQGPVDIPGLQPEQRFEMTNQDTAERVILVIAQKGYPPVGLNAPSISTVAQVGDTFSFEWQIDGLGSPPVAQVYPPWSVPFPCTANRIRLVANVNGTIQIDINKNTFAGYPSMSSICASAIPALAAADTYEDEALAGWTLDLSEGDLLQPEVDAAPAPATLSWVMVALRVVRTG